MKKRIFNICNQLVKQNIKPTLLRVRSELGGGSFSTINPIFKQWKEDSRTRDIQSIVHLRNEIVAINQKAAFLILKATDDHCDKIKNEHQNEITTLQIKAAEADVTISALRADIEAIKNEKAILEIRLMFYELIGNRLKFKPTVRSL
ncbi:MAG: DNA-binding protein [Methylococcaceae bacterium]|nr:DNA-binding protein [Methylococcaceae bacterium]MDD1615969.1 DNA-binding protein [Methylococcaceae bacterium]OYV18940.1 MAG: hypothetical protein CG439_1085 [Methylococcaceae bacterium NSP1-2]